MPLSPETQAALTPAQALQRLKEGHARFRSGMERAHDYHAHVRATAAGQFPFAAVLGCIDSRVPAEVIFDQSFGDLFVARVAGNVVNDDLLGSLEFATEVAGAKLIVVLGHTRCGAVQGACDGVRLGHLTGLLERIAPAVAAAAARGEPAAGEAFVEAVAEANVHLSAAQLLAASPILRARAERGALAVVGAMYDVTTGTATFFD